MKRKPLESRFEVHFDGWEAYLVDEFMEYPFVDGRNRVNSAETVVRVELNRIYRLGEGNLTGEQRKDLKNFGGVQKILEEARRLRYVPGRVEKDYVVKPEPVRNLKLKSFALELSFGGIPAFMIDTLISKGRFDGRKDILAKNLISSYFEENADFMVNCGIKITREDAIKMRYMKAA